jgi:hypothetical protein
MSNKPVKIVLRLDPAIEFEKEFAEQYQAVPRSRRQEWLRSVLRTGLCAVQAVPVIASARTAQALPKPVHAPQPEVPASITPQVSAVGAASDLKGMF